MKNKKGFTLVELLVSFALITAISLAFFRTILSLQQEQLKNIAKNNYKAFTIVLNNSIQKDFLNDNIEKIISCGDSCYDITYTKNGITRLELDKENKIITYGNIKEKLPADYKFIGDIEFTSYINSYDGNDSYIALNINVKSNYEKGIDNIKYVYQYDSDNEIIELDVDGAEASDIIEYLLYKSPEENGLYEPLLPDGISTGIRYRGANPNNYVYFNCEDKDSSNIDYGEENYNYKDSCEIWRIIGVFDVDNGKGNIEKRVKLVRNESLLSASWDSSASDVNGGYGINEWSESDLNKILNGYYLSTTNECYYCNDKEQQICNNSCINSFKVLSDKSVNMIDDVRWYTAAIQWNLDLTLFNIYMQERGKLTGKQLCTQGEPFCNDIVPRKKDNVDKIGLIYVSDYGYATTNNECYNKMINSGCAKNNWLTKTKTFWSISPIIDESYNYVAVYTSTIEGNDRFNYHHAFELHAIHPSLYLKSNITFIGDGNGTEDSPYILGINE